MMDERSRELPIWRTTTRILGLLVRNFIPFGLLSAVFQIPGVLFTQGQAPTRQPPNLSELGFVFVNMFIQSILVGTVTHSVLEQLRGRRGVIVDSFGVGLRRIFPLFGVSLCVFFLVMVGLILLIVPGFLALAMFSLAIPALVSERIGVVDALNRSRQLTRGNRLRILGVGTLFIGSIYGAMTFVFIFMAIGGKKPDLQGIQIYFMFVGALLGLVLMVGEAVVYEKLRTMHEGPGKEALGEIFE